MTNYSFALERIEALNKLANTGTYLDYNPFPAREVSKFTKEFAHATDNCKDKNSLEQANLNHYLSLLTELSERYFEHFKANNLSQHYDIIDTLGYLYMQQGRYEEAAQIYNEGFKLTDSHRYTNFAVEANKVVQRGKCFIEVKEQYSLTEALMKVSIIEGNLNCRTILDQYEGLIQQVSITPYLMYKALNGLMNYRSSILITSKPLFEDTTWIYEDPNRRENSLAAGIHKPYVVEVTISKCRMEEIGSTLVHELAHEAFDNLYSFDRDYDNSFEVVWWEGRKGLALPYVESHDNENDKKQRDDYHEAQRAVVRNVLAILDIEHEEVTDKTSLWEFVRGLNTTKLNDHADNVVFKLISEVKEHRSQNNSNETLVENLVKRATWIPYFPLFILRLLTVFENYNEHSLDAEFIVKEPEFRVDKEFFDKFKFVLEPLTAYICQYTMPKLLEAIESHPARHMITDFDPTQDFGCGLAGEPSIEITVEVQV